MNVFTEKTIEIIRNIPEGRVMTYGQIARVAGNPRAARQVARVLHSMSKKYKLPWYRVINSKGKISFEDNELYNEQKLSLQSEGVEFKNDVNLIDLDRYQYHPVEKFAYSFWN